MSIRSKAISAGTALAVFAATWFPALAQYGLRTTPIAVCYLSSMSAATKLSAGVCASFTGTGSGTNLTVTSVSGLIQPGMTLAGTGVAAGTTIVSQTSGTPGKAGVYVTSAATTSSSASLTAGGIPVNWGPAGNVSATYASICAYAQGVVWRDDGGDPTATAGSGGQALLASSTVRDCMPYSGNFLLFEAIQLQSGAFLAVSYYR